MARNSVVATIPSLRLQNRLAFYSQRYGALSTMLRYIGRLSPRFWMKAGRLGTSGYLQRWLESDGEHILNLGGGGHCIEGCLTVDITPRADAFVDFTKPLPFPDASVDAIFCEEVIEHVSYKNGQLMLCQCYRILKPNGILRITTPDLNYFAAHLEDCDSINWIFYEHEHRYIYTRMKLEQSCLNAGFTDLRPSFYQDPDSRLGYLDSHPDRYRHSPDISYYLEARKPKS